MLRDVFLCFVTFFLASIFVAYDTWNQNFFFRFRAGKFSSAAPTIDAWANKSQPASVVLICGGRGRWQSCQGRRRQQRELQLQEKTESAVAGATTRRAAATAAMAGTAALVREAMVGRNPVFIIAGCGRQDADGADNNDDGGDYQHRRPRTMPLCVATQRTHPESLQPISCHGWARGQSTRGLINYSTTNQSSFLAHFCMTLK